MVKKPSQQALNRAAVTVEQAEALAQRLADIAVIFCQQRLGIRGA